MPGFNELVLVIVLAALGGFLAHLLRQPAFVGFIGTGLLAGYFERLGLTGLSSFQSLASIGIALLLFLVGIEMDWRELKRVSRPALLIGLGQIVFTFILGFYLVLALGFTQLAAFYIAAALTFSSTIIVVRLLSEKKDLNSLYGRIVVGVLLVQDFVAILLLVFLAGLGSGGQVDLLTFSRTLIIGLILLAFTLLASRLLPRLLELVGRSQEMLFLFSLAWALGLSALAAASGLSIEIGGFLAGLSLARSAEHFQISARLRPLRDFFLLLFFVVLGAQIVEAGGTIPFLPAVILALFVLIGNPLVVLLLMGILGYRARTSFLASLAVAQISEFSFVVMALGYRLGHLGSSEVALVILVGLFTIFISSYLILYGSRLYELFYPLVRRFEFRRQLVEEVPPTAKWQDHIILAGVHRMGESVIKALANAGLKFVALDFDPAVVKKFAPLGLPVVYGDITDRAIQEIVGLSQARIVISTIPDFRDNLAVLEAAKGNNAQIKVILTAENEWQAKELYRQGADYVLLPHFLGGRELAEIIGRDSDLSGLAELKKRDLALMGGAN